MLRSAVCARNNPTCGRRNSALPSLPVLGYFGLTLLFKRLSYRNSITYSSSFFCVRVRKKLFFCVQSAIQAICLNVSRFLSLEQTLLVRYDIFCKRFFTSLYACTILIPMSHCTKIVKSRTWGNELNVCSDLGIQFL